MEQQTPPQDPRPPHGGEQVSNAGQGFGVAGIILGGIALVIAFIPCIGIIALVPGVIAIVLSIVGLIQANQYNAAKGLIIAALVVSILATGVAALWGFFIGGVSRDAGKWRDRIERVADETGRESVRELRRSLINLGDELERTFGDLEGFDPEMYDFGEEITDEEFEKVMEEFEALVKEFAGLARKTEKGELASLVRYSSVSVRAASMAATLIRIGPKLTEEQQERFREATEKYENILEKVEE